MIAFARIRSPRTALVAACILTPCVAAAAGPIEQHLSWTGDTSTSIDVVWSDATSTTESVKYGTSSSYGSTATELGTPFQIPGETFYSHHLKITSLTAGTTYHYLVPSGADHTFVTSASSSFSFTAFGDQGSAVTVGTSAGGGCGLSDPGGGPGSVTAIQNVATEAAASGAAIGIYLGDCAYSSGSAAWDAWYANNSPLSAQAGWLVTVGNHDEPNGQGPGTGVDGQNFYGRLRFPSPFSPANDSAWWSIDYGGVHFIFLNSDQYGSAAQLAWLDQDLQSAAAKQANWRVVSFHQPAFSSSCYGGDPYEAGAQKAFVPKLDSYSSTAHIDLVLQGHRHVYERTMALRGTTPTVDTAAYNAGTSTYTLGPGSGTVYVTAGGGGHDLHGWSMAQPAWSAKRASMFHWLEVAVTSSKLTVTVHDPLKSGAAFETFTIQRSGSSPTGDGGAPGTDGGTPGKDGGSGTTTDGGSPSGDASANEADGGSGATPTSGCGCTSVGAQSRIDILGWLAGILAVWAVVRRRR